MVDVSLSGSGEFPTGRGSVSVVTMVATFANRWDQAPDQGPSQDEALHAQDDDGNMATASNAPAMAAMRGATVVAQIAEGDGGDEVVAAAEVVAVAEEVVVVARARSARLLWQWREQVEVDSQSTNGMDKARSGDTSNESGSVPVSPSQDGSPSTDVPLGSVGEEHDGGRVEICQRTAENRDSAGSTGRLRHNKGS